MSEDNQRRNPFPIYKYPVDTFRDNPVIGWKWIDETGAECEKVYATQLDALKDLLRYIEWLNHGPTLVQKVWWPIRYTLWPKVLEFIHS